MMRVESASALAPEYDAIVIGSGYGGGVAASRLARMGFSVAVLEQGRHWQPGEFPSSTKAKRKTTRVTGRLGGIGDPSGMYRMTVGKGLTVFAATGLGGGSLINAGAALRPNMRLLREFGWPSALLDDGLFELGLSLGEDMFGVSPIPDPMRFGKFGSMHRAASATDTRLNIQNLTIAHRAGENAAGVMQEACTHCGDCWSGCNNNAKSTVGITYVADAVNHGAMVFCQSRADLIAKSADSWNVEVKDLSGARADRKISAPILVLAAGTLGTNELLLRARDRGLPLSNLLGERFSANGDDLVIATGLPAPVRAVATGCPSRAPEGMPPVGAHSMAWFDLGEGSAPLSMHDGTMLTMMAGISPYKELLQGGFARAFRLMRGGIYGDEQSRAQIFYLVGRDDARGSVRLHKGNVVVDWPEYSDCPDRIAAEKKAKAMIEKMGGTFQANPFALKLFGGNRIIAHPLGGCGMAETVSRGVVAPDGQVFDPTAGAAGVHEGLYVCDAAAIPTSVGVSPLLTITAIAERAMILAARRLGRSLDVSHPWQRAASRATG